MAEPMTRERFLDRWRAFKGEPQQVAGIWGLYDSIAQLETGGDILDEQAQWARTFSKPPATTAPIPQARPKASPQAAEVQVPGAAGKTGSKGNPLLVPFFDQTNNGPQGWRQCQTSSIAMNLAFLKIKGIRDDLDYLKIVDRFGDTTKQSSHLQALSYIQAPGRFITNCTVERAKAEIDKGYGLAVGLLHHGPVSAPTGGGHYIAIRGYDANGWLVHDPYGEADLIGGGWARSGHGSGKNQHYSFQNMNPRWLPDGPASGWAWLFS